MNEYIVTVNGEKQYAELFPIEQIKADLRVSCIEDLEGNILFERK